MAEHERRDINREQETVLRLAREAIEGRFAHGDEGILNVDPKDLAKTSKRLVEPGASFVTIMHDTKLRGCRGTVRPGTDPLYFDIITNALYAAFEEDPRPGMQRITQPEMKDAKLEVSVLTDKLREVKFRGGEDLLQKLVPGRDGVLISYRDKSAVFLPDVWYESGLEEPAKFLNALCEKAGLSSTAWQRLPIKVEVFHTQSFSE